MTTAIRCWSVYLYTVAAVWASHPSQRGVVGTLGCFVIAWDALKRPLFLAQIADELQKEVDQAEDWRIAGGYQDMLRAVQDRAEAMQPGVLRWWWNEKRLEAERERVLADEAARRAAEEELQKHWRAFFDDQARR